jgi:GrpB-like predicted nucleotidyltransferase (UPF0157 family)
MISKKYVFREYSSDYPRLFLLEKQKLRKIFTKALIEHIGSSSVKGLGGKGIIDIGIAVSKKELAKSILKLQKIGYDYRTSGGDIERRFFQKIIKYAGNERRIHIQLTYENSRTWRAMISLRNYLRENVVIAKDYAKIKRMAVKYANGDGQKYKSYKKNFLDNLEKQVLKNK